MGGGKIKFLFTTFATQFFIKKTKMKHKLLTLLTFVCLTSGITGFSQTTSFDWDNCIEITATPKGDFTQKFTLQATQKNNNCNVVGYSFVKGSDANSPELNNYSSTNSKEFEGFGQYQIRVKLSDGSHFTKAYDYQAPAIHFGTGTRYNICTNMIDLTPNIRANSNSADLSEDEAKKYVNKLKYKFYYLEGTDTVHLFSGTYDGNKIPISPSIPEKAKGKRVEGFFTTYDGATSNRIDYDLSAEKPTVKTQVVTTSCPNENGNSSMKLLVKTVGFNYKYVYVYRKSDNQQVKSSDGSNGNFSSVRFSNLNTSEKYYVVAYDKCDNSNEYRIEVTPPSGGITLNSESYTGDGENIENSSGNTFLGATTEEGTLRIAVNLDGYLPNMLGATLTIIDGPSNVGTEGHYMTYENKWGFNNMLPGLYRVRITNGCGDIIETDLEVSAEKDPNAPGGYRLKVKGDDGYITPVKQSLKSYVSDLSCNGSTGTISSKGTTPWQNIKATVVELLNYNANMNIYDPNLPIVESNSSGLFSNMPKGEYITRYKITPRNGDPYYVEGSKVVIKKPESTLDELTVKPIKCSGSNDRFEINLRVVGWTPWNLKIESKNYKTVVREGITTPEYQEAYTGHTNDVFKITVYDKCGNSVVRTISSWEGIPKNPLISTKQPKCVPDGENNPYQLEAVDIPNATYSWYKIDPTSKQRIPLSDQRILKFSNFTQKNSGLYGVEVSTNGCSNKQERYIYANLCEGTIGDGILAGHVLRSTSRKTIDGFDINAVDDKLLYIVVLNDNDKTTPDDDKVVTFIPVNRSSSDFKVKGVKKFDYNFMIRGMAPDRNYKLILTTEPSLTNPVAVLAGDWINSGEYSSVENDTTPDGIIQIPFNSGKTTNGVSGITDIKFGLYTKICSKLPTLNGNIYTPKVGVTSLEGHITGDDWLNQRTGAIMVLESKEHGFVINRVKNPATDITHPVNGMLVYDTTNDCLSLYVDGKWNCLEQDCIDNN